MIGRWLLGTQLGMDVPIGPVGCDPEKRNERKDFIRSRGGLMEKVNLRHKLSLFDSHWDPKIVGELNGHQVKLVKFKGDFVWHKHAIEDELFMTIKGSFDMHFRDRIVCIQEGEFIIVPHGVEHCPCADEETHVLLFEPASTLNTGDAVSERMVEKPERI
jgi:mannose-6-phosphate isomerase-like protein (cupin superfamily)